MAVLKKAEVRAPVLPKETVEVPELGGDVVVRGLLLRERLAIFAPKGNGTEGNFAHIGELLSVAVVDADGLPIFTADQWDEFGAENFAAALSLFNVARRLSGINAEVAQKN